VRARTAARRRKTARKVTQVRKAARRRKATKPAHAANAARRPARAARQPAPTLLPPELLRQPKIAKPQLDRQRRTLPDEERLEQAEPISAEGLADDRQVLAARSGSDELRQRLKLHTETSPEITAGDVDAKWEDAYATGDETPGGDNPTPDQDRVDDIGKALGISYAEDQELQGGEEVTKRDRHRWEFDPASSEDWPHNKKD
jgi:hypothetical protein